MRRSTLLLGLLSSALLLAPLAATAQDASAVAAEVDDGIEIVRDGDELRDLVGPRPVDRDVVDTALIFTSEGGDLRVRCVGFDANGEPVGRAWLKVPANGLRFVLASDLSDGADFVGNAQCGSDGRVVGTAVLLGPGAITDLSVRQRSTRRVTRMRFPVVATY